MDNETLQFRQVRGDSWVTERLADGSMAVFDRQSKNAYFLNAGAAAAWEACGRQASIAAIARGMEARLRTPVTEEAALSALAELEEKRLAESSDVAGLASRRSALKRMGLAAGAAAPVVLALTASEQRVYAQGQGSRAISDIRLKEDIRLLTRLFGLNVYTFRFKGSSVPRIGLVAQEVYEQYPGAVIRGGADPEIEPWRIDYAKLAQVVGDPQAEMLAELALANS